VKTVAMINPNTDPGVTERMLAIARMDAPAGLLLVGLTAESGAPLITNEDELRAAEAAVIALIPRARGFDGAIVAAFGDPGLEAMRAAFNGPVVGIGEAAFEEAARSGRRFAVATTTPDLVAAIERTVERLGLKSRFAGVAPTRGDAVSVTGSPDRSSRNSPRRSTAPEAGQNRRPSLLAAARWLRRPGDWPETGRLPLSSPCRRS
jgi:Asp/Glu/hydantoin racemase